MWWLICYSLGTILYYLGDRLSDVSLSQFLCMFRYLLGGLLG